MSELYDAIHYIAQTTRLAPTLDKGWNQGRLHQAIPAGETA